jgi:hypothetical protein
MKPDCDGDVELMFAQESNPEITSEDEIEDWEDLIDLEALAEEIFRLIKKELLLENERLGR